MEQHEPIDTEFGELLHHPVEPIALRDRGGDRDRSGRPIGDHDVADHVELQPLAGSGHHGRSPPPGEIGDRHRFAGAQTQDPAQVVLDVIVDADDDVVALADAFDDDVGRRTPQRLGADRPRTGVGRPSGHENADLIREKIPSLG